MKISIQGKNYILAERQKLKPGMVRGYLLQVHPDGTRQYISSCFPTETPGIFEIERDSIRYILNIPLRSITRKTMCPV